MILKEFSIDVPGKGRVGVSFYVHFDTGKPTVGEIKIHPDFDSTLPHRAWLKQDEGQWKLFDERPANADKEIVVTPEFLNDDVANRITSKILSILQEY